MTATTRHLIPTLLLALTLALVAEAQPGQGMNGRGAVCRPDRISQGQACDLWIAGDLVRA